MDLRIQVSKVDVYDDGGHHKSDLKIFSKTLQQLRLY